MKVVQHVEELRNDLGLRPAPRAEAFLVAPTAIVAELRNEAEVSVVQLLELPARALHGASAVGIG